MKQTKIKIKVVFFKLVLRQRSSIKTQAADGSACLVDSFPCTKRLKQEWTMYVV